MEPERTHQRALQNLRNICEDRPAEFARVVVQRTTSWEGRPDGKKGNIVGTHFYIELRS